MKNSSRKSTLALAGAAALLISGCATTVPIGGGVPAAVATTHPSQSGSTRPASADLCLYSLASLQNQTRKSLAIIVGMSKSVFGVPSPDFKISLSPSQTWQRSNRGEGGKSDPDVYANPGRLVQVAVLDKNGSFLGSRNLDTMPLGCGEHADPNKRFFSIDIIFTSSRQGLGIKQTVYKHY